MKKTGKISLACFTAIAGITSGMQAYISISARKAVRNNLLKTEGGHFFHWAHGDVYYSVKGQGSPLLFLHDVDPSSSSTEWIFLRSQLTQNHRVYLVDLPGCGRSDKPAIQYTPYLYVSFLRAFIDQVIGEDTAVIACCQSAPFALLTASQEKSGINHLYLINPPAPEPDADTRQLPQKNCLQLRASLFFGDFAYRAVFTPKYIHEQFRRSYLKDARHVSKKLEEIWYESAHRKNGHGRYLYASIKSHYMDLNTIRLLQSLTIPVNILCSSDHLNYLDIAREYIYHKDDITLSEIHDTALYPHLEKPQTVCKLLFEEK